MRRNRTDEDCILWCCPLCACSGVVTMGPEDRLPYGTMALVEATHQQRQPDCAGQLTVIAATNWYQEAAGMFAPQEPEPPAQGTLVETGPREWLPYKEE